MAGQEQQQPQSRDTEVDEDVPAAPPAPADAQASAATQGVDDLLDEIDGVAGVQCRGVRARIRPKGRSVGAPPAAG